MKSKTVFARALLLVLGLSPAASLLAHNKLASSSPEAGATLAQSPAAIELNFADATYLESVELHTAAGEPVSLDFEPPAELASGFSIPLPALTAGSYTLHWKIEGSDTHVLEGELPFSVEEPRP